MPNRLADETSPYLIQHADNPVDWYPWGQEAFQEARRRDVPLFISVGYSSCHWCHVMAHESFEDDAIATMLNESFVNVKVDREERPDVDAVYMDAVQAMTGRGGWPMSVFATPDGQPFYAGTYWPATSRMGMPGFTEVVDAVRTAWVTKRDEVAGQAAQMAEAIAGFERTTPEASEDLSVTDDAARLLVGSAWDRRYGGFGGAPKFPQAMTVSYLLMRHARTGEQEILDAALQALDAMARGGIHDQIAGGFHRYSTDAQWLVPHFEKMLYDNALLLTAYAQAAALTGDDRFARVGRATAEYLLRDLREVGGAFTSATDADSEGEEGIYFVWSAAEFAEVVSSSAADAQLLAEFHGVTDGGNFEGANILHEPVDRAAFANQHGLALADLEGQLATAHAALRERRSTRVAPGLDDKVLTSWNALAIRGLALAGAYLQEPRYVEAAVAAAEFIGQHLVVEGQLHHTWKAGRASVPAFLEDVAGLADAVLTLYEVTGDERWFLRAAELAQDAVERFADPAGGYFQTAHDAEALYLRPKESWDNATPSGNSVLAGVFARLAALTGDAQWWDRATQVIRQFQSAARTMPTGYGHLLGVVEFLLAGPREVAIVGESGESRDALVAAVWSAPRPGTVVAVTAEPESSVVPLHQGRTPVDGRPAAYVCEHFACQRPLTDARELALSLSRG